MSSSDARGVGTRPRTGPFTERLSAVAAAGAAAGTAVLAWQLVNLLLASLHQYHQFNLSLDFAIFHQAWYQIAHGHLDPILTPNPVLTHGVPYWRSHFELIMWPLSLLYWLNRNDGLTLLFVQDLAIVTTEAVAMWWMVVLARRRHVPDVLLAAAVLATAVLAEKDPWLYSAARQDFHFEALAACLALAAAYQIWAGHRVRSWVLVCLTLCCGDVAGTYIAGVGLAFACTTPRIRRQAVAVLGTGVAWVLFVALIGANQGSPISAYGYLALHKPVASGAGGIMAIILGALVHPSRPLHRIDSSWLQISRLVGPTGWLGLVNPWTWGVILLTLLENILNTVDAFRQPTFQNFVVYLFATAGTGLLVVMVAGGTLRRQVLAAILVVGALVSSLWFDSLQREFLVFRSTTQAGVELRQVRALTPPNAEVISTFGVVGRFGGRKSVYTFIQGGNTVPIDEPIVIVLLAPMTGNEPTPPGTLDAFRALLIDHLHARTILNGTAVSAYEWRPRPGQRSITIPT
ncbi:MAG: DUF2079 domain-containing protein [Acidimicrobiales bacterium]